MSAEWRSSSKLPRAPLDFSGGSRAPWDKNLSYILNYGSDLYRKSVIWGGPGEGDVVVATEEGSAKFT